MSDTAQEIYRACLTRPYPILLSRQPQLSKAEAGYGPDSSIDDPPRARHRRSARATANDPAPVTRAGDNASDPAQSTVTFPTSNSASGAASRFQLLVPAAGTQAGLQGHVGSDKNENGLLRNQREDPLLTDILRVNKEVYKEARGVLYSENRFTLDLNTAQSTLACLHQRSRRQIKHIELEIPSYNDILERFQETVRLSLRYCSGLKECRIHMPFMLPGADGSGTTGNTTVYANGFDILRWLPQECNIILEGTTCVEIECVVNKHRHLAKTLDKVSNSLLRIEGEISSPINPFLSPCGDDEIALTPLVLSLQRYYQSYVLHLSPHETSYHLHSKAGVCPAAAHLQRNWAVADLKASHC